MACDFEKVDIVPICKAGVKTKVKDLLTQVISNTVKIFEKITQFLE